MAARVEAVEHRAQRRGRRRRSGTLQRERLVVAGAVAEQRAAAASSSRRVGEPQPDVAAGDQPLELVRRALGDHAAVVEHARSGRRARSASSRYWVVRKIVTPSATSSRMMSHIVCRLRGSSPVVGSSRKITCGSPTSVIARSSRRRMPPE